MWYISIKSGCGKVQKRVFQHLTDFSINLTDFSINQLCLSPVLQMVLPYVSSKIIFIYRMGFPGDSSGWGSSAFLKSLQEKP